MRLIFSSLLVPMLLFVGCNQHQNAGTQHIPNIEIVLSKDLDRSITDVKTSLDYSLIQQQVLYHLSLWIVQDTTQLTQQ